MITDMDTNRFATHSLKDPRILRILSAALDAVDPPTAVRKHLPNVRGNVYGLGIGKASIPMLTALAEAISPLRRARHQQTRFPASSLDYRPPPRFGYGVSASLFPLFEGGHPIPDWTRSAPANALWSLSQP
jgi:glycerate-2-kinase